MCGEILIVEDDEDLREDLAFLIRHRGYPVATAENGQEALQWIADNGRPCVIILDLMMPVMDGPSFHQALLANPNTQTLPVFVVSGAAEVGRKARDMGVAGWFEKPIDLDRLLETVADHCSDGG